MSQLCGAGSQMKDQPRCRYRWHRRRCSRYPLQECSKTQDFVMEKTGPIEPDRREELKRVPCGSGCCNCTEVHPRCMAMHVLIPVHRERERERERHAYV